MLEAGKTLLAALACLKAVESKLQAVIMAPTESLARQHYDTLADIYKGMDIQVALVSGSKKDDISSAHVIVGTHALLYDSIELENVGLVIIDEEQRFGVEQREILQWKAGRPDILTMSATPIPRSLALTAYGEFDVSELDELPPNRKPVKTYVVKDNSKIHDFMIGQLQRGQQCYVICPLVEESESLDLENAESLFMKLKESLKPYTVGLVHGRMNPEEKDSVMREFKDGKISVLVSTTVVEVGINVPNATVMIITDAQRFGLSQLHQLRGRVGRGNHQAYCVLVANPTTDTAVKRLKAIMENNDGFKLAEIDLQIRGPGELFGSRQSGKYDFKLASLENVKMIEAANAVAQEIEITDELLAEIKKRVTGFLCDKEKTDVAVNY